MQTPKVFPKGKMYLLLHIHICITRKHFKTIVPKTRGLTESPTLSERSCRLATEVNHAAADGRQTMAVLGRADAMQVLGVEVWLRGIFEV
jgi:hypothetical protein